MGLICSYTKMKSMLHCVISKTINVKNISAFLFGGKQIPIQPIFQFIQVTDKQILGGEMLHSTLHNNSLTKEQSVQADMTCMTSLPFFKSFSTITVGRLFQSTA